MDRRMHGVIFGGAGELIPTFLNPNCEQGAWPRPTVVLALGAVAQDENRLHQPTAVSAKSTERSQNLVI